MDNGLRKDPEDRRVHSGSAGIGAVAALTGRPTSKMSVIRQQGLIRTKPRRKVSARVPNTAAVCIRREESGPTYAEILRKARERIKLDGLGITDTRIRWAASGDMLIEIPGMERAEKADALATKLREVLQDDARVSRPMIRGEIRIWGLDDSVGIDEVACVVAECGDCLLTDVKTGPMNRMRNGLGSIWVQCPLGTAVKVSKLGKLRIGWSMAGVELLRARPIQCFRCWQFGHVSGRCKATGDRGGACFCCGQVGHIARNCRALPHCVVCGENNLTADHRMG